VRRGSGRGGRRTSFRVRGLGWRKLVGVCQRGEGGGEVPLLDFVKAGKEGHGDEDDDSFFAVADFEL